ncbi:MAG: ATP-binding protein [Syntrophales bacterium]|jgi:hypothetical protein|nr:ATP-binding protein [Syntrophales bacterium]MDD4340309.1 ATP-binding protein [Syntrophales bacterium]HOG08194.1 ATP-binding protein [Syntrophales bacterium]HOS76783.1 ATP-binding protein [Syntrophales bacterium]HPB69420.1 ATP-binding protein [Syntrophales bacterium]
MFVGREKDTARIIRALERGQNVVLTGIHGIGKTILIKHIAALTEKNWRFVFVDFSLAPTQVCRRLLKEFISAGRSTGEIEARTYKSLRYLTANIALKDSRQHIIVLDNLARLTAAKASLLRYLILEKRYLFVAIAETFLPARDLFRLRAELLPAIDVVVKRLPIEETIAFFNDARRRYKLPWTDADVRMLSEASGCYPLGMKDTVSRERNRGWT